METANNRSKSNVDSLLPVKKRKSKSIVQDWTVGNLVITFLFTLSYFIALLFFKQENNQENGLNEYLIWTSTLIPLFLLLSMVATYIKDNLLYKTIPYLRRVYMHYRVKLERAREERKRQKRLKAIREKELEKSRKQLNAKNSIYGIPLDKKTERSKSDTRKN